MCIIHKKTENSVDLRRRHYDKGKEILIFFQIIIKISYIIILYCITRYEYLNLMLIGP